MKSSLLLMLFIVASTTCWSSESLSVRVSIYPPYTLEDRQGNYTGIDAEFFQVIAKEAGYKLEYVDEPWQRGLFRLKTGSIDLVSGVTKTKAREKYIEFIGESYVEQNVIMVMASNKDLQINNLDDFIKDNRVFGVRHDILYSEKFNNRLKTDEVFREHFDFLVDPWLNAKKLKNGRITGFIADMNTSLYSIKYDKNFAGFHVVETPVFPAIPVYFGMSKQGDPRKVERIKQAYQKLKQQGTFQKIINKWTR